MKDPLLYKIYQAVFLVDNAPRTLRIRAEDADG